ncbi:PD-(D/E)XK nuclease family protein [Polynucleobacter sp. MWH-Spelu-300-X4]|uniref:PD-(D/E)XK nuclease family protein n=1 Tax=Polynucleobacter sp. MWH-Spelu-300-X4 TaxID=2689109 RepID=UPI001BFEC196|nr:PD-(D/E)XK nuclease family protein [Polynucleobacter sp. MWH-Spelu-300-X4]QWD80486.1 PD-(D/E)XK nuclease family protein [Polynucleobacter sp. MWH-Spelu-300-X4]
MTYYQPYFLTPDASALDAMAKLIWAITEKDQVSPLVVLSTSGPAYGLRQALEKNRPVGLLPQLTFLPRVLGLSQWLKETPGLKDRGALKTDLDRWLEVYQALSERPYLRSLLLDASDASKWGLAKNIVDVCDVLADANLGVFEEVSDEALNQAIDSVYEGVARSVVDVEAKIIFTFWKNLSTFHDPVARQRLAMGLRIKALEAVKPSSISPLIFIETAKPSPGFGKACHQLLVAYAEQARVHHVQMDYAQLALWPECLDSSEPVDQSTKQANKQSTKEEAEQIQINRQKYFSNMDGRKIIRASGFEDIAWVGANAIQEFLLAGHQHIALVAQDRLVARRIRALLARLGQGISVHDETGWKLSTTRAAASVMSWVDVIRQGTVGPSAVQLMDFLKNPYINWTQLGYEGEDISEFLDHLERRFIQAEVKGSWAGMLLALEMTHDGQSFDAAIHLIKHIREISQKWQSQALSCSVWLKHLQADLQALAMGESFQEDLAGQQLFEALEPMKGVQASLRFNEWLSLLSLMVEESSYLELSPRAQASVTVLPLSATRMRRFDAWVMVGCDDSQLPSISDSPMFLSASLREKMGCKTVDMEFAQQAMDLSQLMQSHQHWRMLWQSMGSSGEPRQPSPWLQRLYMERSNCLSETQVPQSVAYQPTAVLQPRPALGDVVAKPIKVSPSAYRTLRECPYRYYATRVLGLREKSTLDAEVDVSLVGQTLHAALREFYQKQKTQKLTIQDVQEKTNLLIAQLREVSQKHFKPLLEADGRWLGAWVEWESHIPNLVRWQLKREQAGWQFHDAEKQVGFDLQTRFGLIHVSGQVDRIDINAKEKTAAVIDYKYSSESSIKKKQKNIEDDPQLVIYAKAINGDPIADRGASSQAAWVSVKDKDVGFELGVDDLSIEMEHLPAQMIGDIEKVWGGAPLPASGPDSVCQYCEVRGICRKGMWS